MNEPTESIVQAGACRYVLHMLLQRLEKIQPGLVQNLLEGAKSDQASFCSQEITHEVASKVFTEAISFLELIRAQNEMQSDINRSK